MQSNSLAASLVTRGVFLVVSVLLFLGGLKCLSLSREWWAEEQIRRANLPKPTSVRSADGSIYPLVVGWVMIALAAGGGFIAFAPLWMVELALHPSPPRTRAGLDDE